jgi:hypothetical protein
MKTYHLLSIAICLVIFGACAPTYNPTPSNPALLKQKGEVKVSASLSGSAGSLQGAFALSDHFAFNTTLNAFSNSYTLINDTYSSRGTNWDIMPGYFTTFGQNGVFEVFAGYGIGSVKGTEYNGSLHKLYIQPSFGWAKENTEGALTIRLTEVLIPENNPSQGRSAFFLEPLGTIRFGGQYFKGFTQMGFSFSPQFLTGQRPLDFNPFLINIGIQVRVGSREKLGNEGN